MTREEAFAELKKRWGQRARYLVGRRLSSPERRQAAAAQAERLQAELAVLVERARPLQQQIADCKTEARYYKFEVGRTLSIGYQFLGKGDTWEEAFANADALDVKKPADAEQRIPF
jgi:hypothetical protein